jgi:superfamily II DNA or RNA helicase
MLAMRFGPSSARPPHPGLAAFQQEAVMRLERILKERGGAFLCDSVGLGKTHVAAALGRRFREGAAPVLVTGPSQLAAQWRRHMRRDPAWHWLSHAALSRGAGGALKLEGGLIIVDEAHAVRNPATRRYRNLALMCTRARVLLVTATPVNNSLNDFYHLIRLFAADDDFADIGVPDLRSAVTDAANRRGAGALRCVTEAVMVRRTRVVVQRAHGPGSPAGGSLRLDFPRQRPTRYVHYDMMAAYPRLERTFREILPQLRFPAHGPGQRGRQGIAELLRMSLLKRLESSSTAFATSVRRHRRLNDEFLRAAVNRLLLEPACRRTPWHDTGWEQLALDAVLYRPWPETIDRERAIADAVAEARLLDALNASIHCPNRDPKVNALVAALAGDLADERVVIFTEFRDTAQMLWQRLVPLGGAGLVSGNDARLASGPASRRIVIERFAPVANDARPPAPHEAVTRLVATDVLSEGLNLQDARVVVSFDLPWNPVRLAQRIGRIDRLGSPHAEIEVVVFMPDRGLDLALRLLRRIRRKLREIRMVGGDRPRLGVGRSSASCPDPGHESMDLHLERTEMLRYRYTAAAESVPAVPPATSLAAAMLWDGESPATLCCVAASGASWLVLVPSGGRPSVHAAEADSALLAALDGPLGLACDPRRIRNAVRSATAAVRNVAGSHRSLHHSGGVRRAARAVHRWLVQRPGGAERAEIALADALLQALATGGTAGFDHLAQRAARPGRPVEEMVRALERTLSRRGVPLDGAVPGHRRPGSRPRVVATLELVPATRGCREVDPSRPPGLFLGAEKNIPA